MDAFENRDFYTNSIPQTEWSQFLGLQNTGVGQWFNNVTGITKKKNAKEIAALDANPQTIPGRPMSSLPTQPVDTSYGALNKDGSLSNAANIADPGSTTDFVTSLIFNIPYVQSKNAAAGLDRTGQPLSGINPATGQPYPGITVASPESKNAWLKWAIAGGLVLSVAVIVHKIVKRKNVK